eukprot:TRINITY_DN5708_c4_g1_i2.p1 TRINITY_DN5708_c4_g1~~TRINITY_DN5708_c4_g1_i2.p1  ORF type:complete len:312 (+),score=-37.72 TRINITY_DN5708_c4_g1_i2:131-1066(+)
MSHRYYACDNYIALRMKDTKLYLQLITQYGSSARKLVQLLIFKLICSLQSEPFFKFINLTYRTKYSKEIYVKNKDRKIKHIIHLVFPVQFFHYKEIIILYKQYYRRRSFQNSTKYTNLTITVYFIITQTYSGIQYLLNLICTVIFNQYTKCEKIVTKFSQYQHHQKILLYQNFKDILCSSLNIGNIVVQKFSTRINILRNSYPRRNILIMQLNNFNKNYKHSNCQALKLTHSIIGIQINIYIHEMYLDLYPIIWVDPQSYREHPQAGKDNSSRINNAFCMFIILPQDSQFFFSYLAFPQILCPSSEIGYAY